MRRRPPKTRPDAKFDVWVQDYSLESPHFDLINTHHYEPTAVETVKNLERTVEMTERKKPVFVGEFGFISTSGVEEVLDYVIGEEAIPGALIWSLRRHHEGGGWYHHTEPIGYGLYRAYHWPGFDDGEKYDERALMKLMREKAFEIQGRPVPLLSPPKSGSAKQRRSRAQWQKRWGHPTPGRRRRYRTRPRSR